MDLIQVSKVDERLPITRNTAYKWKSINKYPKLLIKVGGKLFFDLDEWAVMARASRDRQVAEAEKARRNLGA